MINIYPLVLKTLLMIYVENFHFHIHQECLMMIQCQIYKSNTIEKIRYLILFTQTKFTIPRGADLIS